MAELGGFNANDVDPDVGIDPIPAGLYPVAITESEHKATKDKKGMFLEMKLVVLEGEYKDRILYARLNLKNQSEKAVQIARGQLSAICRAVGVMVPKDSVELHNIPLVVKVALRKEEGRDPSNEIRRFMTMGDIPKVEGNTKKPW